MKKLIVALLLVFAFSDSQLRAQTKINEQATADVNAVTEVVAKEERDSVAWFLVDSESKKAAGMTVQMVIAKNEINKIPNKGGAHDALVRLLGTLMARETAALDSRTFAYARLKDFSTRDGNAKKALEEATKAVKSRPADPLASKLK
ncbi:hypothetical protein [Luteolibacter soli]|uniref:Uncharacterized protein n=1 Tax=Luteolibacter soli TaxID=3135280 RepID=A0ABU9ATW4_9BACT